MNKSKIIEGPKQLVELMISCEKELGLLNPNSNNYFWEWAAHRMAIYYQIAKSTGALQEAHDDTNSIKGWVSIFKTVGYLLKSPFMSFKTGTILLLPHKRKVLYKGEKVDLNSLYVKEELEHNFEVEIWDLPHNGEHEISGKNIFYLDFISIAGKIGSILGRKFISRRIKNLCNLVKEELEIEFELEKIISGNSIQFKTKYILFKVLLKLKKIKEIYVVIAYGHTALVRAAKDLQIPVIELQHGVINQYHLGYHYPLTKEMDYFPDEILVWHSMWENSADFPLEQSKIKVNQNNHLEKFKERCVRITEPDSILIISQGAIGELLSDYIYQNFERINKYKIYYKLHPGEFESSKNYKSLLKLDKKLNMEIIRNEKTVYELFEKVGNVVGVFSTALYEANYFKKKVFIVPISGFEYMSKLLEKENVEYFRSIN